MWSHNESEQIVGDVPALETVKDKLELQNVDGKEMAFLAPNFWLNWIGSTATKENLALKSWKSDSEYAEYPPGSSNDPENTRSVVDDGAKTDKVETRSSFPTSAKETLKAALNHFGKKWHRRLSFIWKHVQQILRSFQKLWVSYLENLAMITAGEEQYFTLLVACNHSFFWFGSLYPVFYQMQMVLLSFLRKVDLI